MNSDPLRFRQIHLDFHTSPDIPDVGAEFDASAFAQAMVDARVDSVTVFAKCHHGHLYFDTPHPAHHPTLKRNLLAEQIEALHSRNIRAPIYLSAQVDEFAANLHPEWVALNPDGTRVGRRPLANDCFSWQILDMSTSYLDYLEEQILLVLEEFKPVDGLFFDMCWDQPSVSGAAKIGMGRRGLNPGMENDRNLYARMVAQDYMGRISRLVGSRQRNVPLWFNSRPLARVPEEKKFLRHLEIEALPTGQWGYMYFPVHVRFARPLGLPLLGMTGRFHKSWADFGGLRAPASLLYDCSQALAHGGGCSVGDQLHPSGRLDKGAYEVIASVYRYVEKCEPWIRDAGFPKEIAVLYRDPAEHSSAGMVHEGVTRLLNQLRHQFVFLLPEDGWEDYPLVIVPETIECDDAMEARLSAYLERGGAVLREDLRTKESPYSCTYLRFDESAGGTLPKSDHVFYERGVRLEAPEGSEVLARIVEPYFERTWEHFCSHAQTPGRLEASLYAAAFVRGREGVFALPVFRAYARHGNLPCRQLVSAALARLLPQPVLRLDGPSYLEAVIADQGQRRLIHLLSFIPQKRSADIEMVEEAIPARNIAIDLKSPALVRRVSLQPQDIEIPFEQAAGRVRIGLDCVEGHQIIVFDAMEA